MKVFMTEANNWFDLSKPAIKGCSHTSTETLELTEIAIEFRLNGRWFGLKTV
jgi:hypothetical protein